jgi:hypothetical protein
MKAPSEPAFTQFNQATNWKYVSEILTRICVGFISPFVHVENWFLCVRLPNQLSVPLAIYHEIRHTTKAIASFCEEPHDANVYKAVGILLYT